MLPRGARIILCSLPRAVDRSGRGPDPAATVDTTALQRLLAAEDARGTGPEGLEPLLNGLDGYRHAAPAACRPGLGRFQRPELGGGCCPRSADPVPAVRAEAANAIAQSLRRVRRGSTPSDSARALCERRGGRVVERTR